MGKFKGCKYQGISIKLIVWHNNSVKLTALSRSVILSSRVNWSSLFINHGKQLPLATNFLSLYAKYEK